MPRKHRRKAGQLRSLSVVHPNCAGIDIGKDTHYVAINPERCSESVRQFDTLTRDLRELAAFLKKHEVTEVAMESTGVYWIPAFEYLDRAGFSVILVPPKLTRQISGRKSDVLDCQWIWQLHAHGLLRGCFRPPDAHGAVRSLVRQRKRLTEDQSRCVLQMQKALTQMNVRIDSVISDIMGKTGQQILRAIVAGERDPAVLAALRDPRVKAPESLLAASLEGTWRHEHLFALEQSLQRYDFLTGQIEACNRAIMAELDHLGSDSSNPDGDEATVLDDPPSTDHAAARDGPASQKSVLQQSLDRVLGVDLTAIPTIGTETALLITSEVGSDLSRFPSCQHFCSWLGLAPGTRISGDRKLPIKGRMPINRVGQALKVAAMSARRSQSYIGAKHRARLARLDKAKAIKATAHELARLVWMMLTMGQPYVERGIEAFEAERKHRQIQHLKRRATALGLSLHRVETGEVPA